MAGWKDRDRRAAPAMPEVEHRVARWRSSPSPRSGALVCVDSTDPDRGRSVRVSGWSRTPLIGIDHRAATGALYGVGGLGGIYDDRRRQRCGHQVAQMSVVPGTSFGVDFNPTVDRLHVVSDTQQNLRVDVTRRDRDGAGPVSSGRGRGGLHERRRGSEHRDDAVRHRRGG